MTGIFARSCPPGETLTVCRGLPGWSQTCSPVPPASQVRAFGPTVRSGDDFTTCYQWAARVASPSWWTMPHIALAVAVAVLAGVILGAVFALVRDRSRARRFLLRGAR